MGRTVVYGNREFPEPEGALTTVSSAVRRRRTTGPPRRLRKRMPSAGTNWARRVPFTRRRRVTPRRMARVPKRCEEQDGSPEQPKVVASIKGGRAIIGMQTPRRTRTSILSMTQTSRRLPRRSRR